MTISSRSLIISPFKDLRSGEPSLGLGFPCESYTFKLFIRPFKDCNFSRFVFSTNFLAAALARTISPCLSQKKTSSTIFSIKINNSF